MPRGGGGQVYFRRARGRESGNARGDTHIINPIHRDAARAGGGLHGGDYGQTHRQGGRGALDTWPWCDQFGHGRRVRATRGNAALGYYRTETDQEEQAGTIPDHRCRAHDGADHQDDDEYYFRRPDTGDRARGDAAGGRRAAGGGAYRARGRHCRRRDGYVADYSAKSPTSCVGRKSDRASSRDDPECQASDRACRRRSQSQIDPQAIAEFLGQDADPIRHDADGQGRDRRIGRAISRHDSALIRRLCALRARLCGCHHRHRARYHREAAGRHDARDAQSHPYQFLRSHRRHSLYPDARSRRRYFAFVVGDRGKHCPASALGFCILCAYEKKLAGTFARENG